jgi:uncharacterized protein with NAD-binding domain and iron-sulfur cluster
MNNASRKIRVAVVGGGCASLSAAFELSRADLRDRYDVTVYQSGFRLGGKGASARGPSNRIEEHGLHLWMGFYENAFRLMRETYAELGRDRRECHIASWEDAFKPAPHVAVVDRVPGAAGWEPWIAHFPPGRGLPGDPVHPDSPFSVRYYLQQAASLLLELLRSAHEHKPAESAAQTAPSSATPGPDALVSAIDTVLRYGQLATFALLLQASEVLRAALAALAPAAPGGPLLRLIDLIVEASHVRLQQVARRDGELRRVWQVIDVILAILRGSLAVGLAFDPRGFDALDAHDWRDWLRQNGAQPESLDSGFVRGIYDLAFAYVGGDPRRPALAASVALRGAMRMFFTYRGSLFFRMSAGMGDIVFAPLHEVLERRGVRFEFFHRLRDVRLASRVAGERPWVEALDFDVQARTKGGRPYRPLVSVRGLPCWPGSPDYDQLENGEELRREGVAFEAHWDQRRVGTQRLRVGHDFDLVVLGVGLGAIPHVAGELCEREPRWRAMVEGVQTVATQAFQLWMTSDMRALGWQGPAVNLSGFVEPFDTWADMSHLIAEESFLEPVRSIAYFCSVLSDDPSGSVEDPVWHDGQRAKVRQSAIRFLEHDIASIWPAAAPAQGHFRWEVLAAASPEHSALSGAARFDSQFYTANVNPSDRYVVSLPGTSRFRLSPLDRSFDNLTIAGDWTESGLNTGCVESAVMSGLLAAHAISGRPALSDIVGYDHP